MLARGLEPIAETSRLTSIGQARLRLVTQQLRGQIAATGLAWSDYGRFLHSHRPKLDLDSLLRTNQIWLAYYSNELKGPSPNREILETFTDLQRRARPESSFIVWRERISATRNSGR